MPIIDDIVKLLSITVKPRQDSYSDQCSRIVLVKVMMIGAFITGMSWYSDSIQCMIFKSGDKPIVDPGFTSQACWINGFYIYEEIRDHKNSLGYYGLPNEINMNGKYPESGSFCDTDGPNGIETNQGCKPMTKTYFLQFQYMTFFLTGLAVLYYVPYTIFKFVNTDIASLKQAIKEGDEADTLAKSFFNSKIISKTKLNVRIIGNIVIKILYIVVNIVAFLLTDSVLNGRFHSYGTDWMEWSKLNNSIAYDYMGARSFPKPGEHLLPSFGMCEVYETAEDQVQVVVNKYRFICELTQHVLYQYVLMLMWWMMIAGMMVSITGLLVMVYNYIMISINARKRLPRSRASKLTLRELEYLDYVYNKKIPLFGNLLKSLLPEEDVLLNDDYKHPASDSNNQQSG